MSDLDKSRVSSCGFEEMQLHIGDRLQLELLSAGDGNQYFTTLIGYVPGHSVLLRTPLVQNLPVPIPEGARARVRSFSGRSAYTFESRVERVQRSPLPYLHLAYPTAVQQTTIRGALRVRVNLTGTVNSPDSSNDSLPKPVTIADLSISGALLEADHALGNSGDSIELAFKFLVQPNDYEVKLVTPAQIQSGPKPKTGRGREDAFTHGVRFAKLRATEALLLQSYIQQVLLTDRSRVV